MFAMPIALRTDFDADTCRRAAKGSKNGPQARRRLALAAIYEGSSRSEAARISGVTVQIVRDWWTARHAEPSRAVQVAVQGLGKVLAGKWCGACLDAFIRPFKTSLSGRSTYGPKP
jgi:hypothetical protein